MAQVSITALSLPRLHEAHWTAQGAFITSLVTGSFSVYLSCVAQRYLSGLYRPEDVNSWLSRPSTTSDLLKFEKELEDRLLQKPSLDPTERGVEVEKIRAFLENRRWKVASFHSTVMLITPARLLRSSIGSFIIGLGIYLAYVYAKDLNPISDREGARAVLICYLICFFGCCMRFYGSRNLKELETAPLRRWMRMIEKKSTPNLTRAIKGGDVENVVCKELERPPVLQSVEAAALATPEAVQQVKCKQGAAASDALSALEAAIRAHEASAAALRLTIRTYGSQGTSPNTDGRNVDRT